MDNVHFIFRHLKLFILHRIPDFNVIFQITALSGLIPIIILYRLARITYACGSPINELAARKAVIKTSILTWANCPNILSGLIHIWGYDVIMCYSSVNYRLFNIIEPERELTSSQQWPFRETLMASYSEIHF